MSDAAGHDPSRALLGTMRLTGRTGVDAVDGPCGTVADIVVDPQHRRVTHLVVRPGGRHHAPRLVPIEAVTAFAERVTLSWTRAELDAAAPVPHASLLAFGDWPVQTDGRWDPGVAPPFSWTYFGQAGPAALLTQAGLGRLAPFAPRSVDRIPSGTAEVRHASEVVSSDGRIVGHVGGVTVGLDDGILALVVEHGYAWRRRTLPVPIDDVASVVSDQVRLRVTRAELAARPWRPVRPRGGAHDGTPAAPRHRRRGRSRS